MPVIANFRRIFEMVCVLLIAAGKFVFMDILQVPVPFIITVGLGSILYIFVMNRRLPGTANYWGIRTDNFKALAAKLALPTIAVVIMCIVIGFLRGTIITHWHALALLVLYPIWGFPQQFLCMALVAGNLQDQTFIRVPKLVAILLTAGLFGGMHAPNWYLAAGTFILAVVYGFIYWKERNLFILGLLHGWLGVVFYFTVVGEDPWVRVFGN